MSQYPPMMLGFFAAVRDWHRDYGLIHATTRADARRSAFFYAFSDAYLHRVSGAERLDIVSMPTVIAGHSRLKRGNRILIADARALVKHADKVAGDFVASLTA